MNSGLHGVAECRIHRLMAFDESFAVEGIANDHSLEMVAAAGSVLHLHQRAGQAELDQSLNLLRIHRPRNFSAPPAINSTAPTSSVEPERHRDGAIPASLATARE